MNELVDRFVPEATGEAEPFDPDAGKDPAAVALGRSRERLLPHAKRYWFPQGGRPASAVITLRSVAPPHR